jgi:hypothetical protein
MLRMQDFALNISRRGHAPKPPRNFLISLSLE